MERRSYNPRHRARRNTRGRRYLSKDIVPIDIGKYLVRSGRGPSHVVDLGDGYCTCRAFALNGACKHVDDVRAARMDQGPLQRRSA